MHIGINAIGMKPGWNGAEDVYFRNIFKYWQEEGTVKFSLISDNEEVGKQYPYPFIHISKIGRINHAIADNNIDILFSHINRLNFAVKVPVAALVFSLPEITSNTRKGFLGFGKSNLGQGLREKAQTFITASEATKRELLSEHKIPLDKITVARPAVDPVFADEHMCIVEKPYFLTVGKTSKRKNIQMLIDIIEQVSRDSFHNFVVVGRPGDAEPSKWPDSVIRIDYLGTAQLAGIYQSADALINLSTSESTGLTMLEAFRSGTLVLAGRNGAFAEYGGDVPIYINQDNVGSIVSSIKRILTMDEGERKRRIQSGKQHLYDYSWDQCAWKILAALRKTQKVPL
jgi:glycosyltransferase involved in cell wall biosynthesis